VTNPDGQTELVVAIFGRVLGIDPATGKQLWSCATDITWYMVPSLVAHDGVVYCVGGRGGGGALAVRTGGRGDVTTTHRLWMTRKGSNVPSPVYHNGHLYWINESNAHAYCADAATGTVVYEERVGRADTVYASALLADGKVYYLDRQGRTFVVAAKPEFDLLATNDLRDGSTFNASPVALDNRLYIRSDKALYCIGSPR
jgi:outer membrane protein assembly factor BamB